MNTLSLAPAFRSLTATTHFYFVRHGESESNKAGVIQGHLNSPLSATGRDHAAAAGRWFAAKHIDRVFASPLDRSMETAGAIAAACGAEPPSSLDELIEIDTGLFSGKSLSALSAEHPEEFEEFLIHSWESVPSAESMARLRERAYRAWQHLLTAAREGASAVVSVTHGGMLQWLIKATFYQGGQAWMPLFAADNCGIFLFVVDPASRGIPGGGAGEGTSDQSGPRETSCGKRDARVEKRESAATQADPAAHLGYFGQWQLMNLVPYKQQGQPATDYVR